MNNSFTLNSGGTPNLNLSSNNLNGSFTNITSSSNCNNNNNNSILNNNLSTTLTGTNNTNNSNATTSITSSTNTKLTNILANSSVSHFHMDSFTSTSTASSKPYHQSSSSNKKHTSKHQKTFHK